MSINTVSLFGSVGDDDKKLSDALGKHRYMCRHTLIDYGINCALIDIHCNGWKRWLMENQSFMKPLTSFIQGLIFGRQILCRSGQGFFLRRWPIFIVEKVVE